MNNTQRKLDFLIIGVQKAGTSAISYVLSQDSNIAMGTEKELHYFDNDKYFDSSNTPLNLEKDYHERISKKDKAILFGEATPIYIYLDSCIERIKKYNPNIKLILILRDPTERAYSQWNMEVSKRNEAKSFERAILSEVLRYRKMNHPVYSYLSRGSYSKQLKKLLSEFDRKQVLILHYKHLLEDPDAVYEQIYTFLKLPLKPLNWGASISKKVNSIEYKNNINPITKLVLKLYFIIINRNTGKIIELNK